MGGRDKPGHDGKYGVPLRVIPESPQGLSGTQKRGGLRMDRCLWAPVFRCAETGMTQRGGVRRAYVPVRSVMSLLALSR